MRGRSLFSLIAFAAVCVGGVARGDSAVDFTRDIKPIFDASCVSCHGPQKQKGGLRLDLKDAAMQGGDLRGVEGAIRDGYFDALSVRALWLTPWQTQPAGAFPDASGTRSVMGYHGYWPVKAREVDPRLGGAPALRALVAAAHAKGIRVLMDTVLNHVHQGHEYFTAHRDWFRTGCVCG